MAQNPGYTAGASVYNGLALPLPAGSESMKKRPVRSCLREDGRHTCGQPACEGAQGRFKAGPPKGRCISPIPARAMWWGRPRALGEADEGHRLPAVTTGRVPNVSLGPNIRQVQGRWALLSSGTPESSFSGWRAEGAPCEHRFASSSIRAENPARGQSSRVAPKQCIWSGSHRGNSVRTVLLFLRIILEERFPGP